MRAFIAIPLPSDVQSKLAIASAGLPKDVSKVRAENLHVTLAFLGEISESDSKKTMNAMDLAAGANAAFAASSQGVDAFPSATFPRVVFARAQGPGFDGLYKSLCNELEKSGLAVKRDEKFVPHITLGRARKNSSLGDFFNANKAGEFGEFNVESMALFESVLEPAGAKYSIVHSSSLAKP